MLVGALQGGFLFPLANITHAVCLSIFSLSLPTPSCPSCCCCSLVPSWSISAGALWDVQDVPLVPGTAYSLASIKMQISFLCMNPSRGGQWEAGFFVFFSLPSPSFPVCFLERPLIAYYSWVVIVALGEKLSPLTACCMGGGQHVWEERSSPCAL